MGKGSGNKGNRQAGKRVHMAHGTGPSVVVRQAGKKGKPQQYKYGAMCVKEIQKCLSTRIK